MCLYLCPCVRARGRCGRCGCRWVCGECCTHPTTMPLSLPTQPHTHIHMCHNTPTHTLPTQPRIQIHIPTHSGLRRLRRRWRQCLHTHMHIHIHKHPHGRARAHTHPHPHTHTVGHDDSDDDGDSDSEYDDDDDDVTTTLPASPPPPPPLNADTTDAVGEDGVSGGTPAGGTDQDISGEGRTGQW